MRRILALAFVLGVGCWVLPDAASAERRAALVIGINDYAEVPDLEKAAGDARAMSAKLRELGFDVTELVGPGRRAMNQAIATFAASLEDGDMAFVHFSGHGVEIDGENYLLPADVPKPESGQRDFVKSEAIAMSGLIARIADSGARARVFVIDACRNNPFEEAGVRSVGATRGLARVEAPAGTFILYSAGYRQLALDRLGPDDAEETSVYTRTLLRHIGTPGRTIDDVAQDVRGEVEALARQVGHDQRPAYYDELSARLILVAAAGGGSEPAPAPDPAPEAASEAAEAWAATRDTASPAVLEAFIQSFPGTVYAAMAEARLNELSTPVASAPPIGPAPGTAAGDAKYAAELAAEAARLVTTGDHGGAFKLAYSAAEMGSAEGMMIMGDLYATGRGVQYDYAEAVRWFRQAAAAGNTDAMIAVGEAYHAGLGVEANAAEAANWFGQAVKAGDPWGQFRLAILYDQGVPGIEGNSYQAGELAFQALMQSDHDTRQRMAGELAGRSRPMIEIVQRLLAKVGAYGGPIDGDMGPATREAIGKL